MAVAHLFQVFGKSGKNANDPNNRGRSPVREPRLSSLDDQVDEGRVSQGAGESLSPQALREQLDQLQTLASSVQEKDMSKTM